jgi:hypothetical protein
VVQSCPKKHNMSPPCQRFERATYLVTSLPNSTVISLRTKSYWKLFTVMPQRTKEKAPTLARVLCRVMFTNSIHCQISREASAIHRLMYTQRGIHRMMIYPSGHMASLYLTYSQIPAMSSWDLPPTLMAITGSKYVILILCLSTVPDSDKVQLFTHTVLQIYPLSDWCDAICKVDKMVCLLIFFMLWIYPCQAVSMCQSDLGLQGWCRIPIQKKCCCFCHTRQPHPSKWATHKPQYSQFTHFCSYTGQIAVHRYLLKVLTYSMSFLDLLITWFVGFNNGVVKMPITPATPWRW